jgi:hypothetical protein
MEVPECRRPLRLQRSVQKKAPVFVLSTPRHSVIPGHREAMSPESISPSEDVAQWIPGSRRRAPWNDED